MHGLRSAAILVVILAGLGGYIYFVDAKKPASDGPAKTRVFADIAPSDIDDVTIAVAGGDTTHARKSPERWALLEPIQVDADQSELAAIAGNLATLEIERPVDGNPSNLTQYGLDPAHIAVTFRVKGQRTFRLLVGDKTPTSSHVYVMRPGDPRVLLVGLSLESTLNRTTFALRDKQILKLDRAKIDGLEITTAAGTTRLAKKGLDWTITAPIAARADYGTVENILERLTALQMQGISAPDGAVKDYGLDTPSATLVISTGPSRTTLLLGRSDGNLVYAKDAARPMIVTVSPTTPDDVVAPIADLRRKDLFDARPFTATALHITRADATTSFVKTTSADGRETWRTAAGKNVDVTKMDDLLARLTALRAQSFLSTAPVAAKAPVLTVTVTFDNKTETVTFGRTATDVLATRSDDAGVAVVESAIFDEMTKALDAVK